MASSADLEDDSITCPICLEVFMSPRRLAECGHTFCLECLEQMDCELIATDGSDDIIPGVTPSQLSLRCPICRSTNPISSAGVKAFEVNLEAEKKAELVYKEKGHSQHQARKPMKVRRVPGIILPDSANRGTIVPITVATAVAAAAAAHAEDQSDGRCSSCKRTRCCSRWHVGGWGGLIISMFIVFIVTCLPFAVLQGMKQGEEKKEYSSSCIWFFQYCKKYFTPAGLAAARWPTAGTVCQKRNGNLAVIKTEKEFEAAVEVMGAHLQDTPEGTLLYFWSGLVQERNSSNIGSWKWKSSGEFLSPDDFISQHITFAPSVSDGWETDQSKCALFKSDSHRQLTLSSEPCTFSADEIVSGTEDVTKAIPLCQKFYDR